jgi:hypothetical protein
MNANFDIELIYSCCKKKINDTKKYNGWKNWNNWNVHLWLSSDEDYQRLIEGLVNKCVQDEVTEEDAVSMLEIYLLSRGYTETGEGAVVTRDALQEIVSHYWDS